MRITKRLFALILAASLTAVLFACTSEVEEVFISAENKAGGYSFEYPDYFEIIEEGSSTLIAVGGTGGGAERARITVYVEEVSAGTTAQSYWDGHKDAFGASFRNFSLTESKSDSMGGADALLVRYTANFDTDEPVMATSGETSGEEALYYFIQVFAVKDGKLYTLTYVSDYSYYSKYSATLDVVKDSFAFIEAEEESLSPESGEPVGLKRAENKTGDFCFDYSPDWVLDTEEAYIVISKGNASISVIASSLTDANMGAGDYWYREKERVEAAFSAFELKEETEIVLGGFKAIKVSYSAKIAEGKYNFVQVYSVRSDTVFTLTLTADDNDLSSCLSGFETVIESFEFK